MWAPPPENFTPNFSRIGAPAGNLGEERLMGLIVFVIGSWTFVDLLGRTTRFGRRAWSTALALWASALKDIGAICAVLSFAVVAVENIDTLVVVSAKCIRSPYHALTVAVGVSRDCCLRFAHLVRVDCGSDPPRMPATIHSKSKRKETGRGSRSSAKDHRESVQR